MTKMHKRIKEISQNYDDEVVKNSDLPFKLWDIWMEGYAVTGNHNRAQLLANAVQAKTFREACLQYALEKIKEDPSWVNYSFSIEHLSYWGCKWYPDEVSARKHFG